MTDYEIAQITKKAHITEIAKKLNLTSNDLIFYGEDKAKIKNPPQKACGKLVLVTAINPTSSGEGKTTVSIGLADGLNYIGQNACLALREPSLGPVFGIKGGATGGGYAQVVLMEEINLHFTGDFHAITSANNLLCALIDNHIFQGNALKIKEVCFNRCMDMNDRALRNVIVQTAKGETRKERFNITSASEVMSILCLAENLEDLKARLGSILIGYDEEDKPVFAKQLQAENAMTILLKEAIKPNLVQTLHQTPAIVHCGPFANIAHGCNSIIATKTALALADYCITEAGFGADLGAQKFLDFKCRNFNLSPDCVVIVATIKALKLNGTDENHKLTSGLKNLQRHLDNLKNNYKLNVVCALNKFAADLPEEIAEVEKACKQFKTPFTVCSAFADGAKGGAALAHLVEEECKKPSKVQFTYETGDDIKTKIEKIAIKIYRAKKVEFSLIALKQLEKIKAYGFDVFDAIIAKTQYSFTDNKNILGAPEGFTFYITRLDIRAGARCVVAVAGDMMLMPGLSKLPAAVNMQITNDEYITGLF